MEPTEVSLGGRSAQVWKFNADGSPVKVTPEDAAASAIGSLPAHAESARGGITGALGGAFDAVRDVATTGVAKAAQWSPVDVAQMGLSKVTGGHVPMPLTMTEKHGRGTAEDAENTARSVARYIVPQTPAAVTAMAAFGPLSKLGYFAATGLSGALGAGANLATGKDGATGALEGGLGQALPRAVAPALKWITGLPRRFITKAGEESVGMQHADRILKGASTDVPELAAAVKGASPAERLLSTQDYKVGHKALGAMMDTAEGPIVTALPNVQFVIPPAPGAKPPAAAALTPAQMLFQGASPAAQARIQAANPGLNLVPGPAASPPTVGIRTAMKELKTLKAEARAVYSKDNPLASVEMDKRAAQLEDDIYNVVAAQHPQLAEGWKRAMDKFAKGLDYIHLSKATIQGASAKGTPVDIMQSVDHVLQNYRDFAPSRMPGLHANLFPGQAGTQPVVSDPGMYARAFLPGAAHIKANIPSPRFLDQPGVSRGLNLPRNASVPALLNLSQQGLNAIQDR